MIQLILGNIILTKIVVILKKQHLQIPVTSHNSHALRGKMLMQTTWAVRMVLCSHVGSINFADPANIRQVYEVFMSEVRTKAIYINNKYKIPIEPMQFE